jgi:hypothetical protein
MLHSARESALALLDGGPHEHACVLRTLLRFGAGPLRFARSHGIRVVPLGRHETYGARSPALRRLSIDVDAWPAPPAGLFVVEERTVYLRSRSAMTVAHEFGHALDCALGGGIYRSGVDPVLRRLFSEARAFITPYAATGADEYFAESLRAYVEVNDAHSFWPRATRARLRRIDAGIHDYIKQLFQSAFVMAPSSAAGSIDRALRP